MVQIRVVGRHGDVDATVELLCRVAAVSRVSPPTPTATGGVCRHLTALVVDTDCLHAAATVTHRGAPARVGTVEYLVEYGLCVSCREKVVRVAARDAAGVEASGGWSTLNIHTAAHV